MTKPVAAFKGLNNVTAPVRLGMAWLTQADNINITDSGAIERRDGYTLAQAGAFTGAYSTLDFSRMYVVVSGQIRDFPGTVLKMLTSTAPMYWTEINDQVYFNNGTDSGLIESDNEVKAWAWDVPPVPTLAAVTGNLDPGTYQVCFVANLPDGRTTDSGDAAEITLTEGQALQISNIPANTSVYIAPANSTVFQFANVPLGVAMVWNQSPDTLGMDLTLTGKTNPLPAGVGVIQEWKGRIYAAQYLSTEDQSVIWFSQPLAFHLFDQSQDFFMVPGRVTMLAPTDTGLVIGTDKAIHAYDGQAIAQLADYGTVPGKAWDTDGKRLLVWTTRGLCSSMPFQNLTERQVSVAPGVSVAGCIVESSGQKRFVAAIQQGGEAFNDY